MAQNITADMEPSINKIISFWFDPKYPWTRWFIADPKLDAEIQSQFGQLILLARDTSDLDQWAESPQGCLALILLLDQFPRNVFRKSPEAYASDGKAWRIATRAVAQGLDEQLPLVQQSFLYLPFEHDENLLSQVASVALFQGRTKRCKVGSPDKDFIEKGVESAVRHKQVILDFGRFPARNVVLHRQSTVEEIRFLETHPYGF